MTNEIVLTDEQINEAWSNNLTGMFMPVDQIKKFARAVEQAVLHSDEMQRLRDIEAQAERIVIRCGEDGNYLVLTADLDRLRVAMEKRK